MTRDMIAEQLRGLAVPIESVHEDPVGCWSTA